MGRRGLLCANNKTALCFQCQEESLQHVSMHAGELLTHRLELLIKLKERESIFWLRFPFEIQLLTHDGLNKNKSYLSDYLMDLEDRDECSLQIV